MSSISHPAARSSRAAALKADLAMLEGTGGTQIKGLITYSGIGTHAASTAGGNGDTFTPGDVALMDSKLPDAVDSPTAWVMRKAMFAGIMNRRADALATNDGRGAFLLRGPVQTPSALPGELYGTRVVRSAQVTNTPVNNAVTNPSYSLLGSFAEWPAARLAKEVFPGTGVGDT